MKKPFTFKFINELNLCIYFHFRGFPTKSAILNSLQCTSAFYAAGQLQLCNVLFNSVHVRHTVEVAWSQAQMKPMHYCMHSHQCSPKYSTLSCFLFCFYKKKDLPFSSKSALSVSQFKCTSKVGHLFLQFHKFYNSICLMNSCQNPPTCYCNRRFPSCLSPLFQSESSCKAFQFIWKLVLFTHKFQFIYMWIKLISTWKASH